MIRQIIASFLCPNINYNTSIRPLEMLQEQPRFQNVLAPKYAMDLPVSMIKVKSRDTNI